jgi:urease accessory protein
MTGLAALLQLSSATLPVGAYAYSQGLEAAVAAGRVHDEATAAQWIALVLADGVATTEAVIVAECLRLINRDEVAALASLNDRCLALRETRELRAETLQMGRSMALLVRMMPQVAPQLIQELDRLDAEEGLTYPVAWAVAAAARGVDGLPALIGYLYAALENMVLAAVKTVPLGQNAGQRLLSTLGHRLETLARAALDRSLNDMTNFLPGQTLASMHHEHQHTRLFRS